MTLIPRCPTCRSADGFLGTSFAYYMCKHCVPSEQYWTADHARPGEWDVAIASSPWARTRKRLDELHPDGFLWVATTVEECAAVLACRNCHERMGTLTWIGEGSAMDFVHGAGVPWCEVCATEAQLEHARKHAARIPALEQKLEELRRT